MSVALTGWADGLPRAGLLHAPTPIECPARLSEALGVEVLVKREDLSGGAFGGNKVRKLDLLAATPAAQAADVWMAMGGVQSNWVRETAAAAARSGKQMTAFLRGAEPAGPARGNVMLDALLGAEVHFLDTTDYAPLRAAMAQEHDRLAGDGRLGHAFALGGAEPEGVAAWAAGGRELAGQLAEAGATPDAVVVGAGTGSTALGLALGLAAAGCDAQVWGVSASWQADVLAAEAQRLAELTAERVGAGPIPVPPSLRWDDRHVGAGYTISTPEGQRELQRLARTAGLIADLTYSGKALAGLAQLVDERTLRQGSTVVFVHTGGAPELFARDKPSMEEDT